MRPQVKLVLEELPDLLDGRLVILEENVKLVK